jgi:hypothetical protein
VLGIAAVEFHGAQEPLVSFLEAAHGRLHVWKLLSGCALRRFLWLFSALRPSGPGCAPDDLAALKV